MNNFQDDFIENLIFYRTQKGMSQLELSGICDCAKSTIGGIESRLRKLGQNLNIHKVHPHKFRRTLATMAIDKGMPIEQLQRLLGHQRIDTTLQYAMVKQSNVKLAHKKYIG